MSVEKLFLFLSLSILASSQMVCLNFTCSTNTTNCISVNGLTVEVSPCEANNYCDLDTSTCKPIVIPPQTSLPAGVVCNSTFECSVNCINSTCQGNAEGSNCSDSTFCSADTYCSSQGKCTKLIANGGNCTDDTPCLQGSQCMNGSCTQMFSLSNGAELPEGYCIDDKSVFCASYQCYVPSVGSPICIAAYVTQTPIPVLCSSDSNCLAISGDYKTYGQCTCAVTQYFGAAFCSMQIGDYYSQKFLVKNKQWFGSTAIKRCSVIADTQLCMIAQWSVADYVEYMYYQTMMGGYVQFGYSSDCVRDTLVPEYEYWKSRLPTSDALAIATFIVGYFI